MIAISFLGVGNYNATKYLYDDTIVETNHFTHALSEFVKPDRLYTIMTEKARAMHYRDLKSLCDIIAIDIPDGKSEDEFWIIFDKITSVVKEGDEIIFDITHGFRSQPFIVIVLLLYLQATKNIKINNILYGAYEARNEDNISPVFKLKSFIDLMEWSNAAREFNDNGNMKYFRTLLSDIHRNSHLGKMGKPSQQLMGAGKDLENLTHAFDTIRLNEVFDTTASFNQRLKELLSDLENQPRSKPFRTLLETIVKKFSPISVADKSIFSNKGMDAQKAIINWYVETNKYQKAITLIREYIISKYLVEVLVAEPNTLLGKKLRTDTENELGRLMKIAQSGRGGKDRKSEYGTLWNKITDIRNDINHAGMRKNPKSSSAIIKNITDIVNDINNGF